jgi:hypothetical protein
MTKGIRDLNWKKKVLEWQASGKSIPAWSKENNIPSTTLRGWKDRFEKAKEKRSPQAKPSTAFIELEDKAPVTSGIFLEHQDIKIRLEPGFNPSVLKQCLKCLRGDPC